MVAAHILNRTCARAAQDVDKESAEAAKESAAAEQQQQQQNNQQQQQQQQQEQQQQQQHQQQQCSGKLSRMMHVEFVARRLLPGWLLVCL